MDAVFLTVDEVLVIHDDQIARYGGSPGMRDRGLLESAVAMPEAGFGGEYLHEFPFGMASAYLFHLAQNHPFVDGNKRVALACALLFLSTNGIELEATEDELVEVTLAVASGQLDKPEIARFLSEHVAPR